MLSGLTTHNFAAHSRRGLFELFAVDLAKLELETTSDELCFPIVAKTQGRIATVCL